MNQNYYHKGGYNNRKENNPLNRDLDEAIKIIFKDKKEGKDYEEYLNEIENITKNLEISTTKLRKLFEIVESIREDLKRGYSDDERTKKKILDKLLKFRVILEYSKNRETKNSGYYPLLKRIVEHAIKQADKKSFKIFVDTMEAIIAFSKNEKR